MENHTEAEIQREVAYRIAEAEGIGRNPERARAEAEAWKAAILQGSRRDEPRAIH